VLIYKIGGYMKIVIVILTMFILTGCGEKRVNNIDSNIEESKIKMNTNNEVVGLKKIDGLQIEKTIYFLDHHLLYFC